MELETQFLVWIKRKNAAARKSNVINLATSGAATSCANAWLAEAITSRGSALFERLAEPSEFGLPSLKNAIRSAFAIPAGREIVATSGASGGIRLVCELLLAGQAGAEVVIETPVYQPLRLIPERLGAKIISVNRSNGMEAVARAASKNTVAVFLTNLHNPTGHWLRHEELSELASRLQTANCRAAIVVDETFSDLGAFPGTTAASVGPRIVTISSLSKCHGLSTLRCGWVTADPNFLTNFTEDAVLFENNTSKIAEALGAMALQGIDAFRQAARELVDRNRPLVSEWLGETAAAGLIEPQQAPAGCIVFPKLLTGGSSRELADALEARYGVLVAPGSFFGEGFDHHVRIGFGGDYDVLNRGLSRLTDGLMGLRR